MLCYQDNWRAVYHREVVSDPALLAKPPAFAEEDVVFPFDGEFALVATWDCG